MLIAKSSKPERSLYYGGALILEDLISNSGSQPIAILLEHMKETHGMSASMLLLCLDWLFLAEAAFVDERGVVQICS